MQAPFHQELAFALMHELDRLCGRRVAVFGIDHFEPADIELMVACDGRDLGCDQLRPRQRRAAQPFEDTVMSFIGCGDSQAHHSR